MSPYYSFIINQKSSFNKDRATVTNLRGFGMKVKKELYGKIIPTELTANMFGGDKVKTTPYNGVWVKDSDNSKFLFISNNELDKFMERAGSKKELAPARFKGFWFFKREVLAVGEIANIVNKNKVSRAEGDEYYGMYISLFDKEVFILMTHKEYERLLYRASKNEDDIPADSYEI